MYIFHPYFHLAFLLFCLNQWIESRGIFIPYVHAYLDDLLAMPIVLGFALAFQQRLTYRNLHYVFSIHHVWITVLLYSLYFEWWMPSQADNHYGDPWDVVAYALGGWFFYKKMNRPALLNELS